MGRDPTVLSVHGMQPAPRTSFGLSRSFASARAREALFVASLALRSSPSCKTRSARLYDASQLSQAAEPREERTREEIEKKKDRGEERKAEKLVYYSGTRREARRGIDERNGNVASNEEIISRRRERERQCTVTRNMIITKC